MSPSAPAPTEDGEHGAASDGAIVAHVVAAIRAAAVRTEPFTHAYVENVFPDAFYAALAAVFPEPGGAASEALARVADRRHQRDAYSDRRLTVDAAALPEEQRATLPAPVRQVVRVMTDPRLVQFQVGHFSRILGPIMRAFLDRAKIDPAVARFDVERSCELIYDATGFELKPHTDGNRKLVTSLVYVPGPGAPESLGTHLYTPRPGMVLSKDAARGGLFLDWADAVDCGHVPYRANCMLIFPRTATSLHGVPPVEGAHPRRLIQSSILHGGFVRFAAEGGE